MATGWQPAAISCLSRRIDIARQATNPMKRMSNFSRTHEAIELDDHFSDNMHLLSNTATS